MSYKSYKNLNFAQVATDVLEQWNQKEIFEKSVSQKEGKPTFTFYEGPPSANGTPGIHHVMARAIKDFVCRFQTMKGFQVKRKGGWDTHGLPVELQVEKELGITKEDIGKKISIEEYNAKCKEAVMKYTDEWDLLTQRMGYWVDLDNPYITYERDYMESLWSILKKFYDKGLLYKGYTIQPYSPAAGTGLSSHELNQPGTYRDVKDTSIVAQFKIKGADNEFFIAWTTTPWTLPANSALAVGKNITYVKVKTFNQYTFEPIQVILAKDRMSSYFSAKAADATFAEYKPGDKLIPFEVIGEMKGADLVGMKYEQLMPYIPLPDPAFTVIAADFVTTEDGTGIVHISKTFGADDYMVSVKNNIPGVLIKDEKGQDAPIVDGQGRFVKEITDFAGMYVKNYTDEDESDPAYRSTDVKIAIKLKEENRAFKVEKYTHSYPHCWRTDKPILYYPLSSWFIKTTAYKERMVELNKTINWKPKSTGEGRFGNWLENLVDWNLSRSRFWGTPLPIWMTKDLKEEICIGSVEELRAEVTKSIEAGFMKEQIADDIDLHRPYVDDIVLVSSTGQAMYRELDLIDVWFDSGAMPYAQWHYPFENIEEFEKSFPADFIAEGVDQTRGWFFTLHAIATLLFDSVAYKNVMSNGLVLDKKGNKMSKRLGNAVNPFDTLDKYGADATRWYMLSNANPWDNLKFDEAGVIEVQRKFFGTLHNTYSFFALYANLDKFDFSHGEIPVAERPESDRWIISRLNSLIKKADAEFVDYEPTRATRAIQAFVNDDLSNWYVRLNRKRFWRGELDSDKLAAYQTLYTCLIEVAKLAAPVAPFYTDQLYNDLNAVGKKESHESVHLADYPVCNETLIDLDLEEKMDLAQNASSLVHSLRKQHNLKVRLPLSKIMIPILKASTKVKIEAVSEIILNEVNVKAIEFIDSNSGVLVKKIKPNFKVLGKKFGPKMKAIAQAIGGFSQEDIASLEENGGMTLDLDGEKLELEINDFEISSQDIPGWSVANNDKLTVALDINVTEELKREGFARDFVNRIQNQRKEQGLEVQDKIGVDVVGSDEFVQQALNDNKVYICSETQATRLTFVETAADTVALDIDGQELVVKIVVEA